MKSVFISYARDASHTQAAALAVRLGSLAFLDTEDINEGSVFPDKILQGILGAHVAVIFANEAYFKRRFCRLEMRLAMSAGDKSAKHLVLALGDGCGSILDILPTALACRNWLSEDETVGLERMVRETLDRSAEPLGAFLQEDEARRLTQAFLEESDLPEPRALRGMACALPPGFSNYSLGSRFVGRGNELRRLHRSLSTGDHCLATLTSRVTAGAGFGKTQLAAEYVHRYGARYYPGGVFWVNADGTSLETEWWRILSEIDPQIPSLAAMLADGRDVRKELARALRNRGAPGLYVIDNIPESGPGQTPASIGDYCPAIGAVTVLATSRQDTREPGVTSFVIDALSRDASVLLLTDGVPASGVVKWAEWCEIAAWVGHLPIALDLLNRALATGSISPRELLLRVQTTAKSMDVTNELQRLVSSLKGQVPIGAVCGIADALSMSYERLERPAQKLALVLAQLGPTAIPEAFVRVLPDNLNCPAALAALKTRHFVAGGDGETFGVMHRLTVAFLRGLTENHDLSCFKTACLALTRLMTAKACRDPKNWTTMNLYRPHAETLFDLGILRGAETTWSCELGHVSAILCSEQGQYQRARELDERVLEARTRMLGVDHPDTVLSMGNLAQRFSELGEHAAAKEIEERVLEIRRRALGPTHSDTLLAMNNLSLTLARMNDLAAARDLSEKVLALRLSVHGEEHPETVTAMINYGSLLYQGDNIDDAIRLVSKALQIIKRAGMNSKLTSLALNNLGGMFAKKCDYRSARGLHEEALELYARTLGDDHPSSINSLENLVDTIRRQQRDHADLPILERRLLDLRIRVSGPQHRKTLEAMWNLAFTLMLRGDYTTARSINEVALPISTRLLGPDHPDTLRLTANLATTLIATGQPHRGRELMQMCVTRMRQVLGENHPDTLWAAKCLASFEASE